MVLATQAKALRRRYRKLIQNGKTYDGDILNFLSLRTWSVGRLSATSEAAWFLRGRACNCMVGCSTYTT